MAIYCLAISPDDVTIKIFQKFKGKLRAHLNRHYGGANSLAHITLILFVASEENYPLILTELKKVTNNLIPFTVNLSNFKDFPSRPFGTFYANPNEYSASKIKRYCRIINKRFRDTVKAKCIEWQVKAFKNPHMSIARELTNVEILLSYDLLGNDFTHSFQCNSFVIRKLNEFKGQYDIIDEIPLSGRGFLDDGPQMTIKFD